MKMTTFVKALPYIFAVPFLILALLVVGISVNREHARKEIEAAIERMNTVSNFDEVGTLLNTCSALGVVCHLDDYGTTYMGHHAPFSYVRIEYYRNWYQEKKNPYATAIVQIERRPRAELVRYDF